jgi:hypothetical protein
MITFVSRSVESFRGRRKEVFFEEGGRSLLEEGGRTKEEGEYC